MPHGLLLLLFEALLFQCRMQSNQSYKLQPEKKTSNVNTTENKVLKNPTHVKCWYRFDLMFYDALGWNLHDVFGFCRLSLPLLLCFQDLVSILRKTTTNHHASACFEMELLVKCENLFFNLNGRRY